MRTGSSLGKLFYISISSCSRHRFGYAGLRRSADSFGFDGGRVTMFASHEGVRRLLVWQRAVPLLALLLLAPARTIASCGDPIMMAHSSGTVWHVTDSSIPQLPMPHDAPKPCHGPGCSGKQSSLPMPSSGPTTGKSREIGCMVHGQVIVRISFASNYLPESADALAASPVSIYHPPR
jgi:hypothetical protein